MNINIYCGKGGVGKTLSASAEAAYRAQQVPSVAIIDYDGGHSVMSTIGLRGKIKANWPQQVFLTNLDSISVAIIESLEYVGIGQWKKDRRKIDGYFHQFPRNLGIIPFADMLQEFFGAPTDVPTLEKFATLVGILSHLSANDFKHVIIDVEPTAGLERMLANAESLVRSLRRLKEKGRLFFMTVGTIWPDLRKYLESDYIQNIEEYSDNIRETAKLLKQANYYLVCTPEMGPVHQTRDVRKIIERFGGKVSGCVVNNVRGENNESCALEKLESLHCDLPLAVITHYEGMHDPNADREYLLKLIGLKLMSSFDSK